MCPHSLEQHAPGLGGRVQELAGGGEHDASNRVHGENLKGTEGGGQASRQVQLEVEHITPCPVGMAWHGTLPSCLLSYLA